MELKKLKAKNNARALKFSEEILGRKVGSLEGKEIGVSEMIALSYGRVKAGYYPEKAPLTFEQYEDKALDLSMEELSELNENFS